MDGIEKIIQKILAEADEKIAQINEKATAVANAKIADAKSWASEYTCAQTDILEKDKAEILSRRLTVADLDVRKAVLEEKSKVVEKVFDLALSMLCSLDKKAYLSFVEKLLIENAEEGDEVLLSSDNILCKEDIIGLTVYSDRKLSVGKESHKERGGVLLVGKNADKDLSFFAVLENLKGDLVSKVAIKLFGEN